VRLTDFGLCKIVPKNGKTYTLCGTPNFMAPEVILNSRTTGYDHMVDFWCLGIVLYEMAAKQHPFVGETFPELTGNIVKNEPQFPVKKLFFDETLVSLLSGLLTKDPLRRLGKDETALRNHPYFSTIDWEKLEQKQLFPPALETRALRLSGPALFGVSAPESPKVAKNLNLSMEVKEEVEEEIKEEVKEEVKEEIKEVEEEIKEEIKEEVKEEVKEVSVAEDSEEDEVDDSD
jgi:serine/threonine protein kinase